MGLAQQLLIPLALNDGQNRVVAVDSVTLVQHEGGVLVLQMRFCQMGVPISREHTATLTPRLFTGTDSLDFPSVTLYGTWAYYHEVRSEGSNSSLYEPFLLRARDVKNYTPYVRDTNYREWMQKARLKFVVTQSDGCGNLLSSDERELVLPQTTVLVPYEVTETETLTDTVTETRTSYLQGTAYISYPVNRTEIRPDYRGNQRELASIQHTLDSLIGLRGVVMKRFTLKGYASPEGSYANNERLARGRVHSLCQYILDRYDIDRNIVSLDYEPEDWEGLRAYVDQSQLPEREQLLQVIDSSQDPDAKLNVISRRFPAAYRHLLDSVFPRLPHPDYRFDYLVRTDLQEEREAGTTTTTTIAYRPDTVNAIARQVEGLALPAITVADFPAYKPLVAVKTNLFFDLLLAPNIEIELPLDKERRWSLMVEDWFPWFRMKHNKAGNRNQYYRSDQRPTKYSYQVWTLGAELRYWLLPRCESGRPWLSGLFVGGYLAGGKYDVEWKSKGDQGEFTSLGVTIGHSWPIAQKWNLELSGSVGYVGGPKRHYEAEFDDARLIYRYKNRLSYFGPTKFKFSLVYLIGKKS